MSEREAARFVLTIDVGTSSVRSMLFTHDAAPVQGAEAQLKYNRTLHLDGTAEVDADELFQVTLETIDKVLAEHTDRRHIAGVGISTFWHGLLAAADEKPQSPLILWSDSRSWRQAEQLAEQVDAEAVRQRTGCPIHPTYWPAKLLWLRKERADLWKRKPKWMSFGELFCWRLFGRPATSVSLASGTGLLRVRDCEWDLELLKKVGVDEESLPELCDTLTGLRGEFARRWPALAGIPWTVPLGDGALASLGSGCVAPSVRALTIGTSGALRVMAPAPPKTIPEGLFCYRLDRSAIVAGAASSNGGNLHEWMRNTLALDLETLEADLEKQAPGSHGLSFLPLLAGERSLGYASHATGAIAGLTLATTPAQIVRAGLEGIAVEFSRYNQRIDQSWPRAKRIVASGAGLLKSPAWMQMLADAIGRPVAAGEAKEASSRGAAIMALRAAEAWDGRSSDPGISATYEPNRAAHKVYDRELAKQEALYELLVRDRLLEAPARSAHYIYRRRSSERSATSH